MWSQKADDLTIDDIKCICMKQINQILTFSIVFPESRKMIGFGSRALLNAGQRNCVPWYIRKEFKFLYRVARLAKNRQYERKWEKLTTVLKTWKDANDTKNGRFVC